MIASLFLTIAFAGADIPSDLKEVGIADRTGVLVSKDTLILRDEAGLSVRLGQFFSSGKPVLLNLVYYRCPSLCTFQLTALVRSLRSLDWLPGREFEIVTVSIDPREGPELASGKRKAYLTELGKEGASWHFLTGEESEIRRLAREVGFGYRYDEKEKQYAHSAASFILTPEGRLSRTLFGMDPAPEDMKLALLEAAGRKAGGIVILSLSCFVMVMAGMLWFAFRYRAKQGGRATFIAHPVALEVAWTAIPIVLIGIVFVWGYALAGADLKVRLAGRTTFPERTHLVHTTTD